MEKPAAFPYPAVMLRELGRRLRRVTASIITLLGVTAEDHGSDADFQGPG
jgi:hypothetical protein